MAADDIFDSNEDEKVKLLALLPQLRALGYRRVRIEYDGSGDSGEVYEPQFTPNKRPPKEIVAAVEDLACELTPDGYENNDGGAGVITLNVEEGTIEHEHNEFYTESNHYEQTFSAADLED